MKSAVKLTAKSKNQKTKIMFKKSNKQKNKISFTQIRRTTECPLEQ